MTPARVIVAILWLLDAVGAACAQTELRWIVDPARPAPADWPVFQGETVMLEPSFVAYGTTLPLTNVTAALYWQTNGMDTAWWTVPAEVVTGATPRVRATWSPTNDCGAARYSYFISLSAAGGLSYRAYGRLMMRTSPGATPSVLGAPTTLTDALAAWGDARYDPAGTVQAVSNALAGALLAESGARIAGDAEALHTTWPATGTVARALSLTLGATAFWFENDGATTSVAWATLTSNIVVTAVGGDGYQGPALGSVYGPPTWLSGDGAWLFHGSGIGMGDYIALRGQTNDIYGAGTWEAVYDTSMFWAPLTWFPDADPGMLPRRMTQYGTTQYFDLDWQVLTNTVDITSLIQVRAEAAAAAATHNTNAASHVDIRAGVVAATNALTGDIIAGELPVQRWQMYDFGVSSNRWLILTNDVLEIWEQ